MSFALLRASVASATIFIWILSYPLSASGQPVWERVAPPNSVFSFESPGRPRMEQKEGRGIGGQRVIQREYETKVLFFGDSFYTAAVTHYGGELADHKAQMENLAKVYEETLDQKKWDRMKWDMKDGSFTLKVKGTMGKKELHAYIVGTPSEIVTMMFEGIVPMYVEQFFSSLRIEGRP